MNTIESIRVALLSLWANKLRSVLTLLGVVIGVAAVIAVVTFVNGINGYVAEKIFNFGANVFIINKRTPLVLSPAQFLEGQRRKNLKIEDYEAVLEACRHCEAVGAEQRIFSGQVKYDEQLGTDVAVKGWTPSMGRITDFDVVLGRMINETDLNSATPVAIIGYDIVDNLMPGVDPIGKEVRVNGLPYSVIGVGKRQGKTLGQSQDNYVVMPITTYQRQFGSNNSSIGISGKAFGVGEQLEMAVDESRAILRARRHDMPGKPDSFTAETNGTFLGIWANLSGTFFYAMIAIASISLLVGGIVIMNIMLVSVTERTREIGIRKAMGARRSDVLRQFLIESATMALVGGLAGVLLGAGFAKTVTALIGMPSSIEPLSIVAGLVVATSVGIFFGVYPARRAALLDPIVALRSEL